MFDSIFKNYLWKLMVIYLDDILIFSKTFEEHCRHVKQVIQRILDFELTIKASKTKMFDKEIVYLGYFFRNGKVEILMKQR